MNDTKNREGLVPSLLVFGDLPRFSPFNTELAGQADRKRGLQMKRAEMKTISAEFRRKRALISRFSEISNHNLVSLG